MSKFFCNYSSSRSYTGYHIKWDPHKTMYPSSRWPLPFLTDVSRTRKKRETADHFSMFQSVLAKICANLDTDNTSIRNQLQCKVLCNDYEHVKSIYRSIMVICHVSLVSSSVLQLQILLDGGSTPEQECVSFFFLREKNMSPSRRQQHNC